MSRYYLRPIGDETQYSDAGDYPARPPNRPGFEWIQGNPPPTASRLVKNPLPQKLAEEFDKLPDEVQARFYPLKAAVKLAIEEGKRTIAKEIIQGTAVPAELQSVKDKLLSMFP